MEDNELKYFFNLGSKYRPEFFKRREYIFNDFGKQMDLLILKLAYKYSWPIEAFKEWKDSVFKLFKESYVQCSNGCLNNNRFYNKKIKVKVEKIKKLFIITTVDKADNNFAFICKAFYKKLLINEYTVNKTYECLDLHSKDIYSHISKITKVLKFNFNNFNFPYLFATVKFHKKPVKFRFVTCNTNCYNNQASKKFFWYLNKVLKVIIEEPKCKIIYNNRKVLEVVKNMGNCIKFIETFDFENLFTSIPHNEIKNICETLFENYAHLFDCNKSYWINLVEFCIFENILFNGSFYLRQIKGIPMGNTFSSAFANLYLHYYENKYIETSNNNFLAYRYIDDIIVFNYEEFENKVKDIYPEILILKKTSVHDNVNIFDLNIRVKEDGCLIGLYDKRMDFNFRVKSLADWRSCLCKKVFRNILVSQFNRIKNNCNNEEDFQKATKIFYEAAIDNDYPVYFVNSIKKNFN